MGAILSVLFSIADLQAELVATRMVFSDVKHTCVLNRYSRNFSS